MLSYIANSPSKVQYFEYSPGRQIITVASNPTSNNLNLAFSKAYKMKSENATSYASS